MKRQIHEKLWEEAGGTLDGLKKLLFDKKNSDYYNEFVERLENKKKLIEV